MSPFFEHVRQALADTPYRYNTEMALHGALAQRLTDASIAFDREVRIVGGRIDFIATQDDGNREHRVGIEVKVGGGAGPLAAQVRRYLREPSLDELLIVSTRRTHRAALVDYAKPVGLLVVGGMG